MTARSQAEAAMSTDQREADALKPCPFCGGDAGFEGVDGGVVTVCLSDSCGATLVTDPLTYHAPHVAAAWNARAPLAPVTDAEVEALAAALRQCLRHIEVDESTHGRPFAAGNVARAALAGRNRA